MEGWWGHPGCREEDSKHKGVTCAECLGVEYMRMLTFSLQSAEPLIICSCYSLVESVTCATPNPGYR